ncbi:DUF4299 family protein [Candidatus Stoquefichus massiliensis]|uniref:DUF4299 family protein n=1 Tax=Candidatus Stoquefichus massiliensis TaxID=1470350 RepID=UPI0004874678|nr:DUF4299 family protein [Candidatus Stoquefichus massiliensis]
MSVDITIYQQGLFKKKLKMKDILMDQFAYGRYDQNYVLIPDERNDNELTIYHPDHIARGISVIWNENEASQIGLHMLLPTTSEEIDDLYLLIEHLCKLWKTTTFIQDGEEKSLNEINELKSYIKDFSYASLQSFLNDHDNGNFFCTMWPYYFRSQDVQHWLTDKTLTNFANDLHQNQIKDLYYANAHMYKTQDDSILGVYTVTATVDTIFPLKPMIPMSCINFQTGESIEADHYIVALVSLEKEKMLGDISFDEFMKELSHHELHEFDSEHIFFEGLSEEEIETIYQKYNG